nr:hypothetical protein [uncultured Anaeromusa sp.]
MGNALVGGLGIIGQVMSYNAQMDAANAKKTAAIQSYNYAAQNATIERQSAFDQAVDAITTTQLKGQAKLGTVDTALGETMSGNSANLIRRAAEGLVARKEGTIRNNYDNRSNEIALNLDARRVSTQSYIDSIQEPSASALLVGIGSSLVGLNNKAENARTEAYTQGMGFDWNKWLWQGSGAVNPTRVSSVSEQDLPTDEIT